MTIRPTFAIRPARPVALALLCLAALVASSQSARSARPRPGDFDPAEYAPYDSAGTASIDGSGSVVPEGSFRRTIAGRDVELFPVTSYSRRVWDAWAHDADPLGKVDVRAGRYRRTVVADSAGHFRFGRLPAGEYFVRASVLTEPVSRGISEHEVVRVLLGTRVRVRAGEAARVALDSLATLRSVRPSMRGSDWTPRAPK